MVHEAISDEELDNIKIILNDVKSEFELLTDHLDQMDPESKEDVNTVKFTSEVSLGLVSMPNFSYAIRVRK